MKIEIRYFLIALFAIASLQAQSQSAPIKMEQVWATDTVLKIPESVLYDHHRDVLYVANMNNINEKGQVDGDGFITKMKTDGKIESLKWVSGLNDPKGMAIHHHTLYVSDLKQLVEIDIHTGKIVKRHDIEGARFLNDVVCSESGDVYISDSWGNKVYKYSDGKASVWLEGADWDKPNGLYIEKEHLLVASMNLGTVRSVSLKTKEIKEVVKDVPSTDGIASDGKGNYFFSNWYGEIYYMNAKGEKWKILDTKDQKMGAADIEYSEKHKLLLVPTFFSNKVVAYKVTAK